MILYHGSDAVKKLEDIKLPGPREDCDFGQGFYLAESKDTAEEWARNEATPVINVYEYHPTPSNEIELKGVDWVRVLLAYREQLFNVKFTKNVVIGAIADDDMRSTLPAFMVGGIAGITDEVLVVSTSAEYIEDYLREAGDEFTF